MLISDDRWLAGQCPTFCQTRSTMAASGTWRSTWSPSTACCPRSASRRLSPVNQGALLIQLDLDETSKFDTFFIIAHGWTTSWSRSWGSMHEACGWRSTRGTRTMSSESRSLEWWLRSTGGSRNSDFNPAFNWWQVSTILSSFERYPWLPTACPVLGCNWCLFLGLLGSA